MNTYIKTTITIFLCIGWLQCVNAQELDPITEKGVKREAQSILSEYKNYGGLTETFTYISDDYVESFTALFEKRTMVLNDIGSPSNTSNLIPIETYMKLIQEWYPEGLKVTLSDVEDKDIGNAYKYKGDKYALRVNVDKDISGLTKKYEKRAESYELTFIFGFDKYGSDVKIMEITKRQALNPQNELVINKPSKPSKPERVKKPKPPKPERIDNTPKGGIYSGKENKAEKGAFFSLLVGPYLSTTTFEVGSALSDIYSIQGLTDNSSVSYHLRGELSYFFSENIGVSLGAGLSSYNSELNIRNIGLANSFYDDDGDGDLVIERIFLGENITENFNVNLLDVSLMLEYKKSIGNKLFLYAGLGGKISSPLTITENNFNRSASSLMYQNEYLEDILDGLIPLNSAEAEYLEDYQLFNEAENTTVKTDTLPTLNNITIVGLAHVGLAYSLNTRLKLKLGGTFGFSGNILDENALISPSESLINVVLRGETVENNYQPVISRTGNQLKVSSIGIEIGLMYKFGDIGL